MGAVLYFQGKLSQSVEYSQEAYRLKRTILGASDPDVANTLGNLALSLGALGRTDEALKANEQAVRMLRSSLGAAHPRVANELSNRGEILLDAKRWDEAIDAYAEADAERLADLLPTLAERHAVVVVDTAGFGNQAATVAAASWRRSYPSRITSVA